MAVSSVSSSSSSSIYGNRNVLTGLASGLDTESMIENIISSYKTKIATLSQKRTKVEWQQESYQSIINKMSSFMDKYTSYRSSNNLMSTSFFDSAVKTITKGTYADKITATGRSSSDIQVNQVKQLATAATYKLSGTALDAGTSAFGSGSISMQADGSLDLDKTLELSAFSGNMTLAYGGSSATSYLSIDFDETKTYANAQEVADEINAQLKSQTINIGTTSYTGDELLNKVLKAEVGADGTISFKDQKSNGVYISDASSSVKEKLLGMSGSANLSSTYDKQVKTLKVGADALRTTETSTLDYLSDKGASISITLDGVTKSIKLPGKGEIPDQITGRARDAKYLEALQADIDKAFGTGKLKVSDANRVESEDGVTDGAGIQFKFEGGQNGSTFTVSSSYGKHLGFGESGAVTSYLNTGKTLGELLKSKNKDLVTVDKDGNVTGLKGFEKAQVEKKDSDGNVVKDKDGKPVMEDVKDANGKQLYSFKVNGVEVGQFNEDSKLSDVLNTMNSNSECGVKVNYSKLTNELTFTAKETGANSKIEFDGLSKELFGTEVDKLGSNFNDSYELYLRDNEQAKLTVHVPGADLGFNVTNKTTTQDVADKINEIWQNRDYTATVNEMTGEIELVNKKGGGKLDFSMDYESGGTKWSVDMPKIETGYTAGQDAILNVTVNGTNLGDITRSSNTVDLDGLSITLKGTFETKADEEPVTFETSSDADKIVNVIKQMVDDYNAMATEIKNAYSTLPVQRSNGKYYEPLTDEDKEGMSESSINAWEEKAKTGILFGDSTLSNLYRSLTSAISMTGEYGTALRNAGITVNYSNGLSTLDFDEDKFRAALASDPDKVRDAFTASKDSGSKSNGLMQSLKVPLDNYGKTSGGKGILVEYAGSPLSPSTMYNNMLQKQLNNIDTQIEKWQDKMNDQVDNYTSKFSKLEQLIQQMNSQSSYFSQLTGGY